MMQLICCEGTNNPCRSEVGKYECSNCGRKFERRDPVVEEVRADLLRRSQIGITKYGTTLLENKCELRDKLQHAYEEALDMANYLKWAILQLDDLKTVSDLIDNHNGN